MTGAPQATLLGALNTAVGAGGVAMVAFSRKAARTGDEPNTAPIAQPRATTSAPRIQDLLVRAVRLAVLVVVIVLVPPLFAVAPSSSVPIHTRATSSTRTAASTRPTPSAARRPASPTASADAPS